MPKTKMASQIRERRRDRVFELLLGRREALALTDEEFGALVGWSKATTHRRIRQQKSSRDWTLGEVTTLASKLGIPPEDLREAIKF